MVLPNENKVGVSVTDTVAGFLDEKVEAGTGINLVKVNSGEDETLRIESTAFNPRGTWSMTEYYSAGDVVTYLGKTYIAVEDSEPTPLDDPTPNNPVITPSKWQLLYTGEGATFEIGTVITGVAGSEASVTNSGTGTAVVLNFVIPKGDKGNTGATGATGATGVAGQNATITVGSTTTGNAGTQALVENVGSASNAVLNFTIPKGDKGDKGDTGLTGSQGLAGTITIGSVLNAPVGNPVTVTNSGTPSAAILNFSIPKGYPSEVTKTSNSSVTIGLGNKTFVYEEISYNIGWAIGSRIRVYYDSSNYMEGVVTTTVDLDSQVTIAVDKILGSGTKANWSLVLIGQPITQAELDLKANITYVDGAISQLINGAPADADTLKELSDKINAINGVIGSISPDGNSIIDTLTELLAVFSTYPEGVDIATALNSKVNTSDIVNNLNQLIAGKVLDATQGKILNDAIALKANTSSLATVATSGSYNDLSNKPTLGSAAALNVGTSANNVVQLDSNGKLPALDGSQLTNISGVGGGHTIQDEGVNLTQRSNLNFVGTAVTATDNAGTDTTTVTVNLPSTGSGLNLGTWDDSGTFTTGVRFDGSTDKVILPKATTAQRTAITPLASELIYDTDEDKFYYGDGTTVGGKVVGGGNFSPLTDKALYYYDSGSGLFKPIGIGTLGQTLIAQPSSNPPYQWATPSGGREVLTGNRTYYVRTDGNDSNNGLTNTSGGAFLTIQKAIDVVAGLDISIYNVLIKCGNGTYAQNIILKDPVGSGNVTLEGDTTTPTNVVINVSSGTCITSASEKYTVQGFHVTTTGSGNGIVTTKGLLKVANINFGAVSERQLYSQTGTIQVIGNYTISGSAYNHVGVQGSGALFLMIQRTVTLTGTPAFNIFAEASVNGSMMLYQNTFSGSATGTRYYITGNGVINVYGAGVSHLPGNATTSPVTGGQYY